VRKLFANFYARQGFAALEIATVHFLSIDVEGLDIEMLEGANEKLLKRYLVCI
jgi:hypothetical protein